MTKTETQRLQLNSKTESQWDALLACANDIILSSDVFHRLWLCLSVPLCFLTLYMTDIKMINVGVVIALIHIKNQLHGILIHFFTNQHTVIAYCISVFILHFFIFIQLKQI